jgi:hypothetical protein
MHNKAPDMNDMGGGEQVGPSAACSLAAAPAPEEGIFDLRANILDDSPSSSRSTIS